MGTEISPADWIGIHQLIGRYTDAVDRHDPVGYESCWTREVITADGTVVSRDAAVQRVVRIWEERAPEEPFRHFVTNVLIHDCSGGHATMRVGMAWATIRAGAVHLEGHYSYDDTLAVEDNVWKYRSRIIGQYKRVIGALPDDRGGY
jgi:hypothetical protein